VETLQSNALDLAYFCLRLTLGAVAGIAAVMVVRYSWRSRRDGRQWVLPMAGGGQLVVATGLSAYDAIDNFILRPHDPITLASWLWFLLVDLTMPVLAILLVRTREQRDRLIEQLARQNVTDQLTGVLNRRGFFDQAVAAVAHARRTGAPTAMVMFDIDHFKSINDGWGHAAGDKVLQAVGAALALERRSGDIVGRLGGEEFALLCYGNTAEMACTGAERLRLAMRRSVAHPAGAERQVTISGGVAAVPSEGEAETAVSLSLTTADAALYEAKRGGRDRIVSAATIGT
jgi:diguanylate cyclase (GGDEF)-like protein